ncbi:coiled-coil domain-containing protein 14 [Trichomycterus rosablanca]|uniref:coiled-coil domain-containing protein 14 n=1 Tax=Trichomycterus rosablanca TaxID=2290929 RepID=UPI002F352F55
MARQGVAKHKVVSSGRLAGTGRGQLIKKKVGGKHVVPLDPAYSLYSTDSEDQVTTLHKGLDRCAALLSDILQAETAESKPKPQVSKMASSKRRVSLGKLEGERKRLGKKSSTFTRTNKRPAPVQKTILPARSYPGLGGQPPPEVNTVTGSEFKTEVNPVTQVQQVQKFPTVGAMPGSSSSLSAAGPQTSTVFNCRLTTSTPALSPQRPTSASSQTSHCGPNGERHHFTQQWAIAAGTPSTNQHTLPTQYTASVSVSPAVHQKPVSTCHQVSIHPEAKVEHRISTPPSIAPHVGSAGQNNPLQLHQPPLLPIQTPMQTPAPTHALVHFSSQEQQISSGECCSSSSEESGDCTSEDEDLNGVDTMPVRDTSCQTSMEKHIVKLNNKSKPASPEKTARKVMTVRYLLGELKAIVANQDSEAVHLISEVEQSISLLPAMVGSTNVQAELALALQPLRSENVQLRRRLRILNQQLQERERAERQARPVDCNLELVALQSLNLTLQAQLNDSHRELGNLQQGNQRLRLALEGKEKDLQQTKERYESETSCILTDASEALAQMRSCQAKLEDSEREKVALAQVLQQKEADITRLQELIRNLQKSPVSFHLAPDASVPRPPAQLTKNALDQYKNQQEATLTDRVSDSVKAYLQTLNDTEHKTLPHQSHIHSQKLFPMSAGQWRGGQESCSLHEVKVNPLKSVEVHASIQHTQEVGQSKTTFVPLRETVTVQPEAVSTQEELPVKHSEENQEANGHAGLRYLGLAFEKLGISNGVSQDVESLDDSRHGDHVNPQLKRTKDSLINLSEEVQRARRCLQMGEASVLTGRPSAFENTFSSCDIKSIASDWSVSSCSTFNTRDEQDFRNGLAALDASIASLQKTLKADLKK